MGENGRLEMIPMLLDAGANINQATYDATFTSLHHALAKGHFECAQLLVDRGADLNLLNEGGCFGTSLHYAVFKDNLDFVKMLIGKGADVNIISGQGFLPFIKLLWEINLRLLKYLLLLEQMLTFRMRN